MENNIHEPGATAPAPGNNNFLAISILVAAVLISGSVLYAVRSGGLSSGKPKIPKTQFAACVVNRKYKDQIQADKQAAETAGVQGTPATFVNGQFINGAQPWSVFKQAIDDALAGKKPVVKSTDPKPEPVGGRDTILGDPNAKVTVIEYGDYQCPFCAKFFLEVEPLIRDQYVKTGKVKMVFRNYPFLDRGAGKQESLLAAEAAECAKDQGQFWGFHDALYNAEHQDGQENNGNLANELFFQLADQLKLK